MEEYHREGALCKRICIRLAKPKALASPRFSESFCKLSKITTFKSHYTSLGTQPSRGAIR